MSCPTDEMLKAMYSPIHGLDCACCRGGNCGHSGNLRDYGFILIPLPEDLRTREGSKRAYDRNYDRIFGPKKETP